MLTDPATVSAARAGDKDALVRILAGHYPQVWRMAVNLAGRLEPGKEVARSIMRQSLAAAEGWEHEEAPTIWFRHHTVLATREAAAKDPTGDDVLLGDGPPEQAYAAFARAVRGLPQQQREAFLLNHGEDFDLRQLGIAMDCSVEAAGMHLRQATLALRAMAGDDFGRFVQRVRAAYRSAAPDEELSLPWTAPRKQWRVWGLLLGLIGWIVLIAVISAIGCGLWWLWPRLVIWSCEKVSVLRWTVRWVNAAVLDDVGGSSHTSPWLELLRALGIALLAVFCLFLYGRGFSTTVLSITRTRSIATGCPSRPMANPPPRMARCITTIRG